MHIRAVVFDYGKVISFPPADSILENIAAICGLSEKTMDELINKYRDDYDRGTVSLKEYYERILKEAKVSADSADFEKLMAIDLEAWARVNPETVSLMEDVKRAGYLLGILSNMPRDFLAYGRRNIPVFQIPDVAVFSCEADLIKPDPKIYRIWLERAACKPEETIFFDDLPANVNAAKELGIHALLWKDANTARNDLFRFGADV
ncbi:MAG: HAD family phosphatase [Spirochaetaceae bacterium]|jgi:putative hydrolase of the HAD superfamily|nr:HAD family phosphatase [Spirochaetaceae bacterium]